MTNQEPRSRPINNNRTIGSLFPTRFLKAAQLLAWKVTEIIVTISRVVEEEVQPKPGQTEWKVVLYFRTKNGNEYPQGYLLSAKVDSESLSQSTAAETVQDLIECRIKIKLDVYRGKSVLRIDPEPVTDTDEPKDEEIKHEEPQRVDPELEEPEEDDYPHSPPWQDEGYTRKDHID